MHGLHPLAECTPMSVNNWMVSTGDSSLAIGMPWASAMIVAAAMGWNALRFGLLTGLSWGLPAQNWAAAGWQGSRRSPSAGAMVGADQMERERDG